MAVVSSHTLNGVDGTHAGGIAVSLRNLNTGETLLTPQWTTAVVWFRTSPKI